MYLLFNTVKYRYQLANWNWAKNIDREFFKKMIFAPFLTLKLQIFSALQNPQ